MAANYDALLLVSFGGPEGPDDVMPFLENVLRGKDVPRERMLDVAGQYRQFGGVSPSNEQNRRLIRELQRELNQHGPQLPIYWGNRNWHPLLADTLRQMAEEGVQRALALFTSAYSSYSGCRQYREDIARAQCEVAASLPSGTSVPQVDKLRAFFNHPGFIEPMIESVSACLEQLSANRRDDALLLFTSHSIPLEMAQHCDYVQQLREACQLVAGGVAHERWELVYQSRSGPPRQPWLEPDICDRLEQLGEQGQVEDIVVLPIGFVADHLEVLFDIDTQARRLADRLGINMLRAATVDTHPRFVQMIRELIVERMGDSPTRKALGTLGPHPDVCPADCCQYQPKRPGTAR